MTREQTIVPLRWPGAQVIEAARAALGKGRPVDIELPLEMHYARTCTPARLATASSRSTL